MQHARFQHEFMSRRTDQTERGKLYSFLVTTKEQLPVLPMLGTGKFESVGELVREFHPGTGSPQASNSISKP